MGKAIQYTSAEYIKELEDKIIEIRKEHKDFGYRKVCGELKNQGIKATKKRVQRIMQKLNLQVTSFTRKIRKYISYKWNVGKIARNRINRRFNTTIPHQKIITDTTEFKYYEIDNKGRLSIQKNLSFGQRLGISNEYLFLCFKRK